MEAGGNGEGQAWSGEWSTFTGEREKEKRQRLWGWPSRALGKGMGVTVVQFLKGGMSGELSPLERLGARIYSGAAGDRFFFQMSEAERKELAQAQTRLLHQALQVPCDLLILDEACAACSLAR